VTYDSALICIAGDANLSAVVVNGTRQNILGLIMREPSDPCLVLSNAGIVEEYSSHMAVAYVSSKVSIASAVGSAHKYGVRIARP